MILRRLSFILSQLGPLRLLSLLSLAPAGSQPLGHRVAAYGHIEEVPGESRAQSIIWSKNSSQAMESKFWLV